MANSAQILRSLSAWKASRAAVLTTYNVSYRFFEQVVVPRLRGAGCQHVLLLADARRFAEAAADAERRPQRAGVDYTLVPVAAPGAFHPKVLLQVGPTHGRAWVGSHNVTHAGFNHNAELTTHADSRGDAVARRMAITAWRAVRAWLPDEALAQEAALGVERLAPWLLEEVVGDEGPVLLHGSESAPLWPQVRALLPPRVDRVTVVGPFFDERLAFVARLAEELAPREVVIGVVPGDVEFPAARRSELPHEARMVLADKLPTRDGAYLHAKAVWFEHAAGSVLVTGSANPSAPAFLGGPRANVEAVVVRELPPGEDPLELAILRQQPALTDEDWAKLPRHVRVEPSPASVPVQVAATLHRQIELDVAVDGVDALRFLGEADVCLATTTQQGRVERIVVPEAVPVERLRWVELLRDDGVVARLMVHHPRVLRRLCRTGGEQRLTEALATLETDRPDLVAVLDLMTPVLELPITRRAVAPRAPLARDKAPHFGSGGVAEPGAEEPAEESYGTEGPLAEILLHLHHRIGVATERSDQSEEELVGSEDEAMVAPPFAPLRQDDRTRMQARFDRVVKRFSRSLTASHGPLPAAGAHARMATLSALLGFAFATVRCTPRTARPWDHLRLVKRETLRDLLFDGVAAAYFQLDLMKARKEAGVEPEELRMIPVLLAWLCCELRIGPPGPPSRFARGPVDDLSERAAWLEVIPSLDKDQWSRLRDRVVATEEPADAAHWFDAASRNAKLLRALRRQLRDEARPGTRAQPADLLALGGAPYTLRVVMDDIGGHDNKWKVVRLIPGDATTQVVSHGVLMSPKAWGPKWTPRG